MGLGKGNSYVFFGFGYELVIGEVDRVVVMGWNFSGVEVGLLWILKRKGRV